LPVGRFVVVRRLVLREFQVVRSAATPRISNHEAGIV
jgi:hypothetical protein